MVKGKMDGTYNVAAKTVEEAIEKATELYGGENKEINYEIVSMPKKGIFGIGSKEAVIKVTVTEDVKLELEDLFGDMKTSKAPSAKEKGRREDAPQKNAGKKEPRPDNRKQGQKNEGEKPAAAAQTETVTAREVKEAHKKEQPAKTKKSEAKEESSQNKKEITEKKIPKDYKKTGVSEEEMNYALEFVNTLISNMKLNATAVAAEAPENEDYEKTEDAALYPAINIIGEDTGILIGHHGETLDAIQYLVNLSSQRRTVGRRGRESLKIKVDVENYRAKREETLRILARKMASRAVRYRKNVFLEPMNPYERRIIHSELQDFENVATHSVGSDKNRKIIITYEGPGKKGSVRQDRQNDAASDPSSEEIAE